MLEHQGANCGLPPTFRELGRRLGIASMNGVSDHMASMEKKGMVRRVVRGGGNAVYVALELKSNSESETKP